MSVLHDLLYDEGDDLREAELLTDVEVSKLDYCARHPVAHRRMVLLSLSGEHFIVS